METSRPLQILRDILAITVVGLFMFPIFWWALTSIKPISAVFDKDRVNFFDFVPTFINYGVTLFGMSRSQLAIDQAEAMAEPAQRLLQLGLASGKPAAAGQGPAVVVIREHGFGRGSTVHSLTVRMLAAA